MDGSEHEQTRPQQNVASTPSRPPAPWRVPLTISLAVVLVLAVGGWLVRRAASATNKVALADEAKGVTVAVARAAKFRESRHYVGTLEPWLFARVGPQVASGYVDTVVVRPGAIVKRGDVLATLDCRSASASSQAISHQARALEARQKGAASEAARLGELLDGGFVAPNEVDQKRAQVASNEAQMQALLAQAAGKTLEVSDCVLRAPFDGEVAARLVDPGAFVRPGSAIVEVVDRSVVRLTGDVPEIDWDAVGPKTPATVKLLATGAEVKGEVARRAPSADPSTRTVHFEIDLPNPTRTFPVGTTAEIRVDVGEAKDAVEIPLLSAKIRGKKATVFVIEDSVAKKIVVGVRGERGGSLFVEPQLKPGTHVVTQGRSLLAANDRVSAKIEDVSVPKGGDKSADGGAP